MEEMTLNGPVQAMILPVHTKNSIRPEDYMIWMGEVMDLNRFEDRRPAIEGRVRAAMKFGFIGQVSK